MSLITYLQRLQFIDFLIRHKATGNLQNLADKNRLSKSHTHAVLKEMREAGFPIKYDRKEQRYYYAEEGDAATFLFGTKNLLTRDEMKNIKADNLCYSEVRIFEICDE